MFDENEVDPVIVGQEYVALNLILNGHMIRLGKDVLSEEDGMELYQWIEQLYKQIEFWENGDR